MDPKTQKRNLILYPVGTIGRDMIYNLFTNFAFTFILFTRGLTAAQLGVVSAIMIGSRVFDAVNDPIMGSIIERTRTRFGKYKPWLVIGILSTSFVVYALFRTTLTGWSFVWFFLVIYLLYSITFTMHDISYWGMVASLGSDSHERDQFTSRATLCSGIGGTLAGFAIPLLTTGSGAIGGNTSYAYKCVALVICLLGPFFLAFTVFGVKETRVDTEAPKSAFSLKKIVDVFRKNDQLLWVAVVFLFQQIGNGLALGGLGSTYIYFELGYEGGYYSIFSTFGLAATAILMALYPRLAARTTRKRLMRTMLGISAAGYALMLLIGLLFPASNASLKCWIFTLAFMAANFGNYSYYLVMMISIINTVEYSEWKFGERNDAMIASVRPFITKLGSAAVIVINYIAYLICGVTDYSQQISAFEQQANLGTISAEEKMAGIGAVIAQVGGGQRFFLLLVLTVLPLACMTVTYKLYVKHYTLDEDRFAAICEELKARNSK